MPKKGANISLSSYDDIFETDASRAEAKQERIQSISILDLVPFENHPFKVVDDEAMLRTTESIVPFPVSWTVKMKKKQKETQDILSYHTQAAGCSDKARAKASGGRQPIEECGRTGL